MIINKLRKLFKDSHGFTMLEMIITVVITAIFFSSVVVILPTVTKSYNKVISLNYARQIATSISDAFEEQLSYAGDVELDTTKCELSYDYKDERRKIDLNENGIIPGLVYDPNYYMGKKVELEVTIPEDNKKICTLTINIYDEVDTLNPLLQKKRVIRLYGI